MAETNNNVNANMNNPYPNEHLGAVWIVLKWRLHFKFAFSPPFFFPSAAVVDQVNSEQCIRALFIGPTNINFQQLFFIKNRSYSTIYIFKNYFTIVFLIFNFNKISSIQQTLMKFKNGKLK